MFELYRGILVCLHFIFLTDVCLYFQKPGGVIALLDEAWYVLNDNV